MEEPDDNSERWIAIAGYAAVIVTYIWALCSKRFIQMVRGVLGTPAFIVAIVMSIISIAAIVGILVGPFWDKPQVTFVFAIFTYCIFAALWVPIILLRHGQSHVDYEIAGPLGEERRPFPMEHFVTQRVVLLGAWATSAYTAQHVWTAAALPLRMAIVCHCAATTFHAFIWDLLYARALISPQSDD
jgi:hypothetical protein